MACEILGGLRRGHHPLQSPLLGQHTLFLDLYSVFRPHYAVIGVTAYFMPTPGVTFHVTLSCLASPVKSNSTFKCHLTSTSPKPLGTPVSPSQPQLDACPWPRARPWQLPPSWSSTFQATQSAVILPVGTTPQNVFIHSWQAAPHQGNSFLTNRGRATHTFNCGAVRD